MARFRLDLNRSEPMPDRRLGIKLDAAGARKRLKGKIDEYVPPELRYEYKPPSVFVRYRTLTLAFVAVFVGITTLWMSAAHRPAQTATKPAAARPQPSPPLSSDQPIYIEPLPSK